jgi:phosphatidate cytidylyltransferase
MALGNLASRFAVAAIAIPILLLILYQDAAWPTWLLVFSASLIAMNEFFVMTLDDEKDRWASLACGALACAAFYWMTPMALAGQGARAASLAGDNDMAMLAFAVLAPMLYYLFRFGDMSTVARRITATIAGIVYAGLCLTALARIKLGFGGRAPHSGGHMVVFVLVVAWVGDTGAYFAGRFLGNKKLYPAVSPKKTWAGAFGGLAGSLVAGLAMKAGLPDQLPLSWVDVVLVAGPGALLGQMGDLSESLIKRSTGVKDSGGLLPGHGGILDRIDAVLFMAPYLMLYSQVRDFVTG